MLQNSLCERNNLVFQQVFSESWNTRIWTLLWDSSHLERKDETWECVGGGVIVLGMHLWKTIMQ